MNFLLEPFLYEYMRNAIIVCTIVGATCAFLSAFLMLKGWSLMGDALAHAVIPGVALSYIFSLPYVIGAFSAGVLAALSMAIVKRKTPLKEDVIIGVIFTSFLSIGLVMASINPIAVNLKGIILGNVLAISIEDLIQVFIISAICFTLLTLYWKDFTLLFFDIRQAQISSINIPRRYILFFTLLSATVVTALQTVGACLVIAMVITPGATAYLLSDSFGRLIAIAVIIGMLSNAFGAYISYFLNVPPGGLIVLLQTLVFFLVFIFAPKHGFLHKRQHWKTKIE